MWAGDADWICNWYGNYDAANAVDYPGKEEFKGKDLKPYTVNGKERGTFKNVENFSFLRVYEAGHMVMYYREYSCPYHIWDNVLIDYQSPRSPCRHLCRRCRRSRSPRLKWGRILRGSCYEYGFLSTVIKKM